MMEGKCLILKWLWLPLLIFLIIFHVASAEQTLSFSSSSSFINRKISPFRSASSETTYAVIFDAGSSGSRLHVFHFDSNLELLYIGNDIDITEKIRPGLSSYSDNPEKAAESLVPLLQKAKTVVPSDLYSTTPILLGATAGLRLLDADKAERILQVARELFKTKSTFKYEADGVTILSGNQEGSYMWATINYLLGNLEGKYSKTVGVVDFGGASVQMAYAISEDAAAQAPNSPQIQDPYIQQFYFKGTKFSLYVHSYLHYGAVAGRAEILKVTKDAPNPCILAGYQGTYKYNGEEYKASASPLGSNLRGCERVILKAMKVNKPCNYSSCSFNGIWNGGGGDGFQNLYFASSFYEVAAKIGLIDLNKKVAEVRPAELKKVAEWACLTKYEDAKVVLPNYFEDKWQFLCMDILYEYSLIVHGFGVDPNKKIALVNQLEYHGANVDVAWPLGNALAVVSKNNEALFVTA